MHKLPDQRAKTSTRLTDEVFYRVPPARGKYSKQAKRELEDFGLNWSTLPDPSQRGVPLPNLPSPEPPTEPVRMTPAQERALRYMQRQDRYMELLARNTHEL